MQDQKLLSRASEKLKQHLNQILELPFYQKLSDGSLEHNNFLSCLYQDHVYLKYFSMFLEEMSAISSTKLASRFLSLYKATNEYVYYIQDVFIKKPSIDCLSTPNTATALYIDHLKNVSETKSVPLMLSAILPCFWIFREIGVISFSNVSDTHPYYKWINTYTDQTFSATTDELIDTIHELENRLSPSIQSDMLDIFLKSTEYELLFWKECYHPYKFDILI